jgi:site-specific recombinase XerD
MKINDAINLYIGSRHQNRKARTVTQDFSTLSHFLFYLRDPNKQVESITLEDCENWLALVKKLGYDDNTRIKKALGIKLFFEHMFKRRVPVGFDPDLIPIPRKVFKFPRVATEDQYKQLLAIVKDEGKLGTLSYGARDRAVIMLVHDTGARNGEIISLDIDDIDLQRKAARIKTEKSRGEVPYREIFWSHETNEQLKKWVKIREKLMEEMTVAEPKALFFGIKAGGNSNYSAKGKRLQVNYVSELFRKYSNKAKLPIINPHSFRHLFGRDLAKKKANNFVISSMMGHARVESSYPYTMLFGKDREEAYRSLRGE